MNKRIIENIFSLSILNVLNMVLPLVTLPYLMKTVGVDKYGAYSIVYSMILYVLLFTEYGFFLSTTKMVSQNRDNINYISRIFSATIVSSLLLSFFPYMILLIISRVVFSTDYMIIFLYGLGIIIGASLNATWLFQGMEKMRYMTIVTFVSKTIFTLLIFACIQSPDDYPIIMLFNSAGYLVAGLLSVYLAKKEFKIIYILPSGSDIKHQIKEGFYVFVSTIFMNLYRNTNPFILGLFISESSVGIYAGAEKIVKACQAVVSPISNAIYPHYSAAFKSNSIIQNLNLIKRFAYRMGILLLVLSCIVYFCAPLLNYILLSNQDETSILLIRIMIPVVFFGGMNYILGIVGLINLGENKSFVLSVAISGLLSISFLLITVNLWGNISAALAMSVAEMILFVLCLFKLTTMKSRSNI